GDNNQAYNNLIYSNHAQGVQVSDNATNAKVYNNTIYGNIASYGVLIDAGVSGTVVENNIIYGNLVPTRNDGASTTFSNNLCDVAYAGCAVVGNPLFVNAAGNDFHLQAGSPARDAGITLSIVTTDYDGIPRPQGVAYDIGAYEYSASQLAAPQTLT